MRYAYGVFIGFIIPGIIFIGASVINLMGLGVTDPIVLSSLWDLYLLWIFSSIVIIIAPLVIAFLKLRTEFREFLIFEAGGIFLFSPMWFILTIEVTGDSIVEVIEEGVENALAFPGEGGALMGVNIGPMVLIPILLASVVFGAFLLRPSFVENLPKETTTPKELVELKKKPEDELDEEMPDVAPPVADSNSIDELRSLLIELSIAETIIESILNSGYATVTDLISSSPETLAKETGIDIKMAQDIHLSVQKKVWFGGIE